MINSILKYIKNIVKSNISLTLLYLFIGFITFFPVLSNGFMGDDSAQIVNNTFIRSLKNIPSFFQGGTFYIGGIDNQLLSDYYRPIMIVWYSLIFSIFHLNPFYYHVAQLLLHIVNGLLVYLILHKFMSDKKVSVLLAIIFLIHPIQTEAIAHLANVQDLLFFFFGSIGLYIFIRKQPSYITLFTILLLFFMAILSKEIAVVFFITLIVYMDLFKVKKNIYRLFWLGSLVTLGLYIYIRCFIAHICRLGGGGYSVIPIARMALLERMKQVPAMFFFYIKTLFFPKTLATYQHWIAQENLYELYIPLIIVLIFFTLIIGIPFYIYINNKKLPANLVKKWFDNNAYTAKIYSFFLLWFLVGLLLHINILPLDATVAERWFYFPFVGILGIIGVLLSLFKNKKYIYAALVIVIILLAIRSHVRALDWSDPYTLYSRDILVSKNSASLENNYGAILLERKKIPEAEMHFRKAIKLAPQSAIYWNNLAVVYEKKRNYKQAEKYYLNSIEHGRFYVAFERYVKLLLIQGRKQKAKKFLKEKAIPTFPYNATFKNIYEEIK